MNQIEIGQDVPQTGEIEFLRGGNVAAHLVRHPRQDGWLVSIAKSELRLKKFKTRSGALRFVMRSIIPHVRIPND